jgi:hypothetical protein
LREGAAVEREITHRFAVDRGAHDGGVRLAGVRGHSDLYHLLDLAQLHANVGTHGMRRRNHDPAHRDGAKARLRCLYEIGAVHHIGEGIVATGPGHNGVPNLRVGIRDSDCDAWQDGACRVGHRADNGAERLLRKRNASTRCDEEQNKTQPADVSTAGVSDRCSERRDMEREVMTQHSPALLIEEMTVSASVATGASTRVGALPYT